MLTARAPDPAELIPEWQRLALELHPVISGDLRPDVRFAGGLDVQMAELEDNFLLADREAVLVGHPPPENEGVVVEPEVRGVDKQHLADLDRIVCVFISRKIDTVLLRGRLDQLGELEQALARRETVRPQDELAAEVFDFWSGRPST